MTEKIKTASVVMVNCGVLNSFTTFNLNPEGIKEAKEFFCQKISESINRTLEEFEEESYIEEKFFTDESLDIYLNY